MKVALLWDEFVCMYIIHYGRFIIRFYPYKHFILKSLSIFLANLSRAVYIADLPVQGICH